MDQKELDFLAQRHSAAMVTLRPDGSPHAVRVGVALVDGKLWSSGLPTRARTAHVRRDPRATVFVFDPATPWQWLSVDATVTILEGPDVPEKSVRLFEAMQRDMESPPPPGTLFWEGQQKSTDQFVQIMADERRIIYEFDIIRSYGMF